MSKEIFTHYYQTNHWQGAESKSGPGSDKAQTRILIRELEYLFKRLDVQSIGDIPCGDWNWMSDVNLEGIRYFGADIVEPLIEQNRAKFGSDLVTFDVLDITNDRLPCVDLMMVRDCLIHLSNDDIYGALWNVKQSGSKWLLTTHYPWLHRQANEEIETGSYHRVDLTREPFNQIPPHHIIFERDLHGWDADKSMALWRVKDLKV